MSTADPAATILLVEDDGPTRTFLADNLTADGYDLLVADCARDGLRLLETKFPDVALVDLGLPDGSGLDVVRRVRASDGVASRIDPAVPLVVVSGRGGELDRLRGFDRGCDDYVCKPFSYPELRARIEALLRRADVRRRPGRLRVGALEIDAASRVVRLRGTPVELSQKEFALVRTLASDPTRVFTKDELLRTIWGFRTLGSNRCRAPYVRLVRRTHARRVGVRCRVAGPSGAQNSFVCRAFMRGGHRKAPATYGRIWLDYARFAPISAPVPIAGHRRATAVAHQPGSCDALLGRRSGCSVPVCSDPERVRPGLRLRAWARDHGLGRWHFQPER